MKIAIDVSQIVYGTGVSVYTRNLVEELIKLNKATGENEYVLFGGSFRQIKNLKLKIKQSLPLHGKNFQGSYTSGIFPLPPMALDMLWNRLHWLPIESFVGRVDVYHSSDWAQAPSKAFKVTTIHDFAPFKFERETHPRIVAVHKRRLRWVRQEVDKIIVPSRATKNDAVRYGFDEKKLVVIAEAAGEEFYRRDKKEVSRVKSKLGIEGEYVLFVGTAARKNLKRALLAFKKLRQKNKKLVVVGDASHNIDDEKAFFVGRVSDDELAALYSGAALLLYPSLYEGFGLTILEAFSCGCPVVCSNVSSLPEVAGEAAVLVDPSSIDAIAKGIRKALEGRDSLIKKGHARARLFSWQTTARETLKVYEEALS